MMADVGDLRQKAEAATPGPWVTRGVSVRAGEGPDGVPLLAVYDREADADHIAAWHPGIALAALRVIEVAEALINYLGLDGAPPEPGEELWDEYDAALRDFREAK